MIKKTRKILAALIRNEMEEAGVTLDSTAHPFPVHIKTIQNILDADRKGNNRTFSTYTQRLLIEHYELEAELEGREYKIIEQ